MILFIFILAISLGIHSTPIAIPENNTSNDACEIDPFQTSLSPLVFRENEIIYPASAVETTIKVDVEEEINIACSGGHILTNGRNTKLDAVTISCISNTEFNINGESYKYKQIKCSRNHESSIQYTGKQCNSNNDLLEVEIGFDISATSVFLRSVLICFNKTSQTAAYSSTIIPSSINNQQKNNPRPSWIQGKDIFSIDNVNSYYIRNKQRSTINDLLGLSSNDKKYIQDNNNFFLSRGHLIARSDNFYGSEQNSTFHLENVLPQWQTFNGDNWNDIEISIRDYAEANDINLEVWTGGYGVTTLPHASTGEEIPLYIYTTNTDELIPIPEVYWKMVYNPISKQGVVLIGVNNPYKSLDEIDKFCEDISNELTWVSWYPNDQTKGFSWACSVDDFRQTVDYVPNIEVDGLLI